MTDRQKVAYMYKYVMQVSDQLQNALNQRHANIYRWQYDEVDCLEEIILLAKIRLSKERSFTQKPIRPLRQR